MLRGLTCTLGTTKRGRLNIMEASFLDFYDGWLSFLMKEVFWRKGAAFQATFFLKLCARTNSPESTIKFLSPHNNQPSTRLRLSCWQIKTKRFPRSGPIVSSEIFSLVNQSLLQGELYIKQKTKRLIVEIRSFVVAWWWRKKSPALWTAGHFQFGNWCSTLIISKWFQPGTGQFPALNETGCLFVALLVFSKDIGFLQTGLDIYPRPFLFLPACNAFKIVDFWT